jgi:hypothetical protein
MAAAPLQGLRAVSGKSGFSQARRRLLEESKKYTYMKLSSKNKRRFRRFFPAGAHG